MATFKTAHHLSLSSVHTLPSYFFMIHLYIILKSMFKSPLSIPLDI
jgi:hypothetical protein